MKYKVYVLFAIIAMMFLINLEGVFAVTPEPYNENLEIESVTYSVGLSENSGGLNEKLYFYAKTYVSSPVSNEIYFAIVYFPNQYILSKDNVGSGTYSEDTIKSNLFKFNLGYSSYIGTPFFAIADSDTVSDASPSVPIIIKDLASNAKTVDEFKSSEFNKPGKVYIIGITEYKNEAFSNRYLVYGPLASNNKVNDEIFAVIDPLKEKYDLSEENVYGYNGLWYYTPLDYMELTKNGAVWFKVIDLGSGGDVDKKAEFIANSNSMTGEYKLAETEKYIHYYVIVANPDVPSAYLAPEVRTTAFYSDANSNLPKLFNDYLTANNQNLDNLDSTDSINSDPNKITLIPDKSSDVGYICDNHVCYYTQAYLDDVDSRIRFLVSGVTGDTCYFSNSINPNWKNDSSNLNNCQESEIDYSFSIGQNIRGKVNVESDSSWLAAVSPESANYLLVGTPENYDYYFFVYVNDLNYFNLLLYKINNRKIIDFYGGSLPEWIPGGIVATPEPEPEPEPDPEEESSVNESDCDKYLATLKSDLNMVDINIFNYNSKTLICVYTSKRADFDLVYNRTNHTEFNSFNDNVFKVAKDGSSPLTPEETAQFWAILAQESTLGTSKNNADTSDIGLAQVNYNTWCAESKRTAGFNELKLYLDFGIDTQAEYNDLCNKIKTSSKFSGGGYTNLDSSTVLARAIYLLRAKQTRGTNNADFPLSSFKIYDDKDAIDAMFAVGYKYKHPSQTFYLSKKYVSTDLTNYTEDISAITQKVAFYLIYKEEMCKQTNQEFIKSYKDNFSPTLPREKGN